MKRTYTPPPSWKAPPRTKPSSSYHGESSPAIVHEAVGRALSTWEHAESALIKLFQLLCETKSLAACRAYGTLEGVNARKQSLKFAAEEFFRDRDAKDLEQLTSLLNAYFAAATYRNEIAHGMAIQPHGFGYFLCPASYRSQKRKTPYPTEQWALGANYFYREHEIEHMRLRFDQIVAATMSMVLYLNEKYSVLPLGILHP